MGEVYRALDTRLDRTVAVKILPEQLSQNPEARQRFEREARAISSLNHRNICILHDVGHQDGIEYLVMEYLEGETLADRLAKGSLPLPQVLKYGVDICEGLDRAHKSGVVHRDLKPGNIMLTKSGAKLMDFGLAKSAPAMAAVSSSSLTMELTSPLASQPLTERGLVVGTFQYMSPEQVEGKEADARTDIFALGSVLYEMATGKRAFEGKSNLSVASAILEKEPEPITTIQPMAPPALDHVYFGEFSGAETQVLAVDVIAKGDQLVTQNYRKLFPVNYVLAGHNSYFDVSPDGRRFLIPIQPQAEAAPMSLVLNWTGKLGK